MRETALRVGGLAVLVAAAVAFGGFVAAPAAAQTVSDNASVGAEISAFMQTTDAATERDVDDGMFEAAMNRTDDEAERQALVEQRRQRLGDRLQQLEDRHTTLGEAPTVRNHSVAARIEVGATGIERSVNGTERAAGAAGVDAESLDELRANARQLRGPAVAELARGLAGPPGDRGPSGERGPPDNAGGPEAGGATGDDDGAPRPAERGGPDAPLDEATPDEQPDADADVRDNRTDNTRGPSDTTPDRPDNDRGGPSAPGNGPSDGRSDGPPA